MCFPALKFQNFAKDFTLQSRKYIFLSFFAWECNLAGILLEQQKTTPNCIRISPSLPFLRERLNQYKAQQKLREDFECCTTLSSHR